MTTPLSKIAAALALGLLLGGCASISVDPVSEVATPVLPQKIYVAEFGTPGDFRVDREGAELKTFKKDLQLMLQAAQTVDLTRRLIPAEAAKAKMTLPMHAWLVRGDFTRVYQGSRLLRGTIGFGAGATKVETRVRVYDLDHPEAKPFLVFATTGGSNAEPGAVTAIATDPLTIAIQAVAGGAGNIAHGLTEDTKRTAREITATLSDYMYRSGWISRDKWIQPKKLSN